METTELATQMARRDLYFFFSVALSRPGEDTFRALLGQEFRQAVGLAIQLAAGPAPAEILWPESPSTLMDAYAGIFGLAGSTDCSPYETEYAANQDLTYRTQQMADVAGFYKAFGLKLSARAHERFDHVSVEAEFMSILIDREIHALDLGLDPEKAAICREAQRAFFHDHLDWWLPVFGQRLERRAGTGFYASVGNLICRFVDAERSRQWPPAVGGGQ